MNWIWFHTYYIFNWLDCWDSSTEVQYSAICKPQREMCLLKLTAIVHTRFQVVGKQRGLCDESWLARCGEEEADYDKWREWVQGEREREREVEKGRAEFVTCQMEEIDPLLPLAHELTETHTHTHNTRAHMCTRAHTDTHSPKRMSLPACSPFGLV